MSALTIAELEAQIERWQRAADRTTHLEERRALLIAIDYLRQRIEPTGNDGTD